MRIGFKLVTGYVFLLGFMGALVFFAIDGEQRLSRHYDALVRLSRLESSIAMIHKTALSGADHNVLLSLSTELSKELGKIRPAKGTNEAAVIRRAQLATVAYKEKMEAMNTLQSGIDRYLELSKENVDNIASDIERIAAILSDQPSALLSASAQTAHEKRAERLKAMQQNVQNLQVALRLMEATSHKDDYDTAKENAGRLLRNGGALRKGLSTADKPVLDRVIVAAKNLNADFIQLGQLYNRGRELTADTSSGLSNVNVAIRQLSEAQSESLAFVRESSILPGVVIIAGAVIVALLFYVLILRSAGGFVSRISQIVSGLAAGEEPPSSDNLRGASQIELTLHEVWSREFEQRKALKQIAEGKMVDDSQNRLGLAALSRAVNEAEITRSKMEQTLRESLQAVNLPATGTASDMLQALKTGVYDASTSLASVAEKVMLLSQSGSKLENGLSQAASQSEQAFAGLHGSNTFNEMATAVSSMLNGNARSGSSFEEIRASFAEIERASKIMGWQVRSYEDVARHLETLAINVNVEAARVGADTTAMGTIVEEIRSLSAKCRTAAEASDNGKTLSSRALDKVFNALNILETQSDSSVATADKDTVKRAAQVLSQLENIELALTSIFTKAGTACSEFVTEVETLVAAVENASATSAKLSEEFSEESMPEDTTDVTQAPIDLTDQVIEFDEDVVTLPKLDL
ncbi:hypothetical protein [Halodesulfovibrio spirochaetisodalis]|uniref:Methyl-accepting transducer domain-containing protein n=1 Tax=Halodesulfovibrio spirochaetisodalis TaxID=1560234 RepID=A0A1B7XQ66_9BACT|nr:hypothetical protein [Halodesulfovibrio spirochaetisodalis]OBQ57664.1 hypothetical protein SP90_01125 [Halodesulfovibrio spirochaetisodalis]